MSACRHDMKFPLYCRHTQIMYMKRSAFRLVGMFWSHLTYTPCYLMSHRILSPCQHVGMTLSPPLYCRHTEFMDMKRSTFQLVGVFWSHFTYTPCYTYMSRILSACRQNMNPPYIADIPNLYTYMKRSAFCLACWCVLIPPYICSLLPICLIEYCRHVGMTWTPLDCRHTQFRIF